MANQAPGKHYREGIALTKLFRMFPNDREAEIWFETERWGKRLYCPRCGGCDRCKETPKRNPMPYWCGDCRRHFSVRTGTILERSKIPLQKWVIGIFLHLSSLKGVSSMKLHRDLEITQKSAWFMLHRIREAYEGPESPMVGPSEIDEGYFGGKEANKHRHKKLNVGGGTGGKTAVVGVKDRKTKQIAAAVIPDTKSETLQEFAKQHVAEGGTMYSDDATAYSDFDHVAKHESVKHSVGEWVRGQAHINGMESFWAMMKRGFHGTYHRMSVKHLHRYVGEFAGRHNIREKDTIEQMQQVFAGMVGKRLMYANLIE